MSHLLRAKFIEGLKDVSSGILPQFFAVDELARYGIGSAVTAVAYDPVQSLLAVGTNEERGGTGRVYVFGGRRVCVTFSLPRSAAVTLLRFAADKLVVVDTKNELVLYSLETRRSLAHYSAPSAITALATDPSLDWAFVGLQTGEVIVYDLDRYALAPLKLPNFWRERSPKIPQLPVVALALHPRDVGKLLIGYAEGAAIYSFKQNKPTNFFCYELPPGAPGGCPVPHLIDSRRHPRLTHVLWHPTGTFILTGHEDGSIVIWDIGDGRVIMARTVQETYVNMPTSGATRRGSRQRPIVDVAWCSKQNPEDTGLLVAGGAATDMPGTALTFLDLGITPNYATSSWQILADHFGSPKRQHILPTSLGADIVSFCLVPRSSPHYAGSHDPIAIVTVLTSGEVMTWGFPAGEPMPANELHVSLSLVHPSAHRMDLTEVERSMWLRMKESRERGKFSLKGGAEAAHPSRRYVRRPILHTCHADGTVRIWDAGHGDDIANEDVIVLDVGMALGRFQDIEVAKVSMAGATGQVAVGMRTGEVIVYEWGRNAQDGRGPSIGAAASGELIDIRGHADPSIKEGLLPRTLFNVQEGPVSTLKMSDIGFVAVGFQSGRFVVIDMRGPAVIYDVNISAIISHNKRSSLVRGASECVTVLEFGIMNVDGDDYSSILCFAGTSHGSIVTLKLLPDPSGRYTVQNAGSMSLDHPVRMTVPLEVETGASAYASQLAAAGLRNGHRVNGVLVAVSVCGVKIFKPASVKRGHKLWDDLSCASAAVVEFQQDSYALVGVFGDGSARAYSLPGLKEIAVARLGKDVYLPRLSEAIITGSGDIFAWTGRSELSVSHVWGTGEGRSKTQDLLFNPEAIIPPRPTISNLQWISGSQYVSPADMDILIGGPDRPMSKRMIEQARADERQRQRESRPGASSSSTTTAQSSPAAGQDEGYWAYMQRQVNERTEKLSVVSESMDQLQERSAGWAKDVSKYVNQQKRKAVLGALGSKLGL